MPGGRLLADLIPDAKLVEVDGADHFWWIMPNWRDIADGVIKFAIGGEIKRTTSRQFATVIFTDVRAMASCGRRARYATCCLAVTRRSSNAVNTN